jgi:hypothetical protein
MLVLADNNIIVQPVIIGRESEIDILQDLLRSRESELLALYGRTHHLRLIKDMQTK